MEIIRITFDYFDLEHEIKNCCCIIQKSKTLLRKVKKKNIFQKLCFFNNLKLYKNYFMK